MSVFIAVEFVPLNPLLVGENVRTLLRVTDHLFVTAKVTVRCLTAVSPGDEVLVHSVAVLLRTNQTTRHGLYRGTLILYVIINFRFSLTSTELNFSAHSFYFVLSNGSIFSSQCTSL